MRKNVWIFHHYGTPPSMSGLVRPYDFAKQLMARGYKPRVFASAYLHYTKENLIKDKNATFLEYEENGVPFTFLKTAAYADNGLSRIKNMVSFYRALFKISKHYQKQGEKPDLILASSPHPLTMIAGERIAKKFQVPCLVEVRDLWPEAFTGYGMMSKKSPIMRMLYRGERWIYKKSDGVIFTVEGGKDYITDHHWQNVIPLDKVHYINNGVDLKQFDENLKYHPYEEPLLDDKSKFTAIYTGSVRRVNSLQLLVDVAEKLSQLKQNDIQILVYGTGNELEPLREQVREKSIQNIHFQGRVDKKYIPSILSRADVNLLHNDAAPMFRYGSSFNKLYDYFAAAKPVLSDIPVGKYDMVIKHKAGLTVDPASVDGIAEALIEIKNMDKETYQALCNNARAAATEYDFPVLTEKLIQIIESLPEK